MSQAFENVWDMSFSKSEHSSAIPTKLAQNFWYKPGK